MAIEQVSVRFAADIDAYVQNVKKAQATLEKYGLTADKTMIKQLQGQAKVVQSQAQIVRSTAQVATETAKMERAQAMAALAQEKLNQQTERGNMINNTAVNALRQVVGQYLGIAAVIGTVKKVVGEGMDFNKFVETSTAAFGVMMKSTDAAKAKMQELYNFAVKSPLTFKETVSASRQLLAYGFSADKLVDTMQTLGTISKATGHSLDDIAYVYGTLRTQGRAYTRDLMQFAMRGIPIYDELAKVMGVPKEQIQKMTEAGKVGFAEVEQAFKNMTTNGGVYAGFLEEYMTTLEGKLSMLSDVWQKTTGLLTEGIATQLKPIIEDLTKALTDNAESFREWGKAIGLALKFLYDFKDVLLVIIGGALITKITTAIAGAGGLIMALKGLVVAIGGPITLAVAAVAAGASFLKFAANAEKAAQKTHDSLVKYDSSETLTTNIEKYRQLGITIQQMYNRLAVLQKAPKSMAAHAEYAKIQSDVAILVREYRELGNVIEDMSRKAEQTDILAEKKYIRQQNTSGGDASKDAWEDALEAFTKYKDAYEKWQASISGDIYAAIDYEYKKNVEILSQKLSAYPELYKTAYKYITEQYEYEREQIRKNAEAKAQADRDALLDKAVVEDIARRESMKQTRQEYAASTYAGMSGIPGMTLDDAQSILDIQEKYAKLAYDARQYGLIALDKAQDEMNTEEQTTKYMQQAAEWLDMSNFYRERGLSLEQDITEEVKKRANLAAYEKATSGSSAYWENKQASAGAAYASGNSLKGAATTLGINTLKGSEVGNMMAGGNPLAQAAIALASFVLSIENVNKVLNPFATILEGARGILEPLINGALSSVVDILTEIGSVLAQILAPFINIAATLLTKITGILQVTIIPVLQIVGGAFAWLNDYVIVPVGNAFIKAINAVIKALNKLPFVNIKLLDELQTTTQALKSLSEAANAQDALTDTIDYLKDKLDKLIDDQLSSLQDLYEVGAITGAAYQAQVSSLQAQRVDTDKQLVSLADQQLSTMQQVSSRLQTLIALQTKISGMSDVELTTLLKQYGIGSYAVGTNYVPQDMLAQVHKGEKIIPADFSSAIDRGEVTLGGGSSGGNVNVVVNVSGSVQTEKDLATSVAAAIYRQRRGGVISY